MEQAPATSVVRVGVAADHPLVADSVRAALVASHFEAWTLRARRDDAATGRRRRRGAAPDSGVDVGLLLSDLDRPERVRAAQAVLGVWDVPWLVLTGAVPGPAWGALYERGAALVVSSTTGLSEVGRLLEGLSGGWTPRDAALRRGELVGAWRSFSRRRVQQERRLSTLTDREDEVLRMLAGGVTVREIAERGEVSETTVRSQVKAILRKLRVSSQIGAVAVFRELQPEGDQLVAEGHKLP